MFFDRELLWMMLDQQHISRFWSWSLPLLIRLKFRCRRPGPLARLWSRLPGPRVAWIARGAGRRETGGVSILYRLKLPRLPNSWLFWSQSIINSMLTRAGIPWGIYVSIKRAIIVHNTVLGRHHISRNITVWIKVWKLCWVQVVFQPFLIVEGWLGCTLLKRIQVDDHRLQISQLWNSKMPHSRSSQVRHLSKSCCRLCMRYRTPDLLLRLLFFVISMIIWHKLLNPLLPATWAGILIAILGTFTAWCAFVPMYVVGKCNFFPESRRCFNCSSLLLVRDGSNIKDIVNVVLLIHIVVVIFINYTNFLCRL